MSLGTWIMFFFALILAKIFYHLTIKPRIEKKRKAEIRQDTCLLIKAYINADENIKPKTKKHVNEYIDKKLMEV